jgi:hypothetical protein
MAIQVQGNSGVVAEVGGTTFRALHVHVKPLEYGALGHYRTAIKLTMAISQAANSRLFEVRDTHATNLLVLTRARVQVMPSGTITTQYAGEIGLFRCTGFSAVDTTNTVTPTASVKRTTGMVAYPGTSAAVRHNTVAGAAAGMTGGTLTKDGNELGNLMFSAVTMAAATLPAVQELMDDMNGTHPLVVQQNEGWEFENVVAGSATANAVQVTIDCAWADVTAF